MNSPQFSRALNAATVITAAAVDLSGATRAIHSTALVATDGAPEWVELVPAGRFNGVDGRGPWQLTDADAVIAKSQEIAGQADLPVDYGHGMELEEFGASAMGAEAAGWITALQARNGAIWGKVEWTPPAAQKIKDRAFRGISPVFFHDKHGVVSWIAGAGLTNRPNLHIKKLNSQIVQQETEVSDTLKAFRARLAALLALPEHSDEDAIVARCSAAVEAENGMVKVASGLKLATTASTDDVVRAAQSQLVVDPSKYVPMEQYKALAGQLETASVKQTETAVDDAIKAGKIMPALREWAKSLHASNPKAFTDFVEKAPVVVQSGTETRVDETKTGEPKLDDSAKAVCAQLDIKPADFVKASPSFSK